MAMSDGSFIRWVQLNLRTSRPVSEKKFYFVQWGSKYTGDLKLELVWILNGRKEVGLLMVQILNGPIFKWLGLKLLP